MELNGKVCLFLGDSITAGVGTSGEQATYWHILGQQTGAIVKGYGLSGTSIAPQLNAMYPEIDLPYFRTRLDTMEPQADLICVLGGTNDYGHGDTPFGNLSDRTEETFCGAMHALCRGIAERWPLATAVILTPLHRADEQRQINERGVRCQKTLAEYVEAERQIAAYYGMPVLDLFTTAGIQPALPIHQEQFMPDGLHPNDAGHARIAQRLIGFLRAL